MRTYQSLAHDPTHRAMIRSLVEAAGTLLLVAGLTFAGCAILGRAALALLF